MSPQNLVRTPAPQPRGRQPPQDSHTRFEEYGAPAPSSVRADCGTTLARGFATDSKTRSTERQLRYQHLWSVGHARGFATDSKTPGIWSLSPVGGAPRAATAQLWEARPAGRRQNRLHHQPQRLARANRLDDKPPQPCPTTPATATS